MLTFMIQRHGIDREMSLPTTHPRDLPAQILEPATIGSKELEYAAAMRMVLCTGTTIATPRSNKPFALLPLQISPAKRSPSIHYLSITSLPNSPEVQWK